MTVLLRLKLTCMQQIISHHIKYNSLSMRIKQRKINLHSAKICDYFEQDIVYNNDLISLRASNIFQNTMLGTYVQINESKNKTVLVNEADYSQ